MELRLLSADEEDLVDPDEDKIRTALTRLPEFSDGAPARAVLVHDNGKDFIQYVAKTKGSKVRNCHVQYCEYLEDGAEFSQYFSEKRTIDQAIKLFQRYAAGDPKWQGRMAWKSFEPSRTHGQLLLMITLIVIGLFFAVVGLSPMFDRPPVYNEGDPWILPLCIALFGISSFVWIRPARAGVPWAAAAGSSLYGGGGGCGSGSGSCSGDGGGGGGGGGGGDGGSCGGGGGCGGGGE